MKHITMRENRITWTQGTKRSHQGSSQHQKQKYQSGLSASIYSKMAWTLSKR